jgi:DNA polymerase|tara:strand:+ start:579 stop:1235 length:657 start_codon:yes stop_codon:yes gene_type:complete
MHIDKNILDFYQSSGLYDRIILRKSNIENKLTLINLKTKIASLASFYNKNKNQAVFSDGNENSKIMIIGDMPGVSDEIKKKPFSGDAGELLDKMLLAINLDRNKVYLTNIINYRLEDNKKPSEKDIQKFLPLIIDHISIINPKIVLLMGAVTSQALIGKENSISKIRGKWFNLKIKNKFINFMPTLHPVFLMRQSEQKKLAWEDLKRFYNKLFSEKLC